MASLYKRPRSPYWYLEYRDHKTGERKNKSTGLRWDDVKQTQQAKVLRAQYEAKEFAAPIVGDSELWEAWVPGFLRTRYPAGDAAVEKTYTRAVNAWKSLKRYFKERGIRSARILTRRDCLEYMAWRVSPPETKDEAGDRRRRQRSKKGRKKGEAVIPRRAVHNTALLELKFLSAIMREAVARELATANVCLQLGVKRARVKAKPEIPDDAVAKIEAALISPDELARPYNEAMQIAWPIAMLQVCRLSETCVPLADVNLEEGTITFRVKGGRDHTAMLHPGLVPLFRRLKAEGRERAFEMPGNFSRKWRDFFERHGLDFTFHSTRVTGVTRLRRAGVDVRVAMDYVGHSSVLIHRVYQRNQKSEQLAAVKALSRSSPSSEIQDDPSAT